MNKKKFVCAIAGMLVATGVGFAAPANSVHRTHSVHLEMNGGQSVEAFRGNRQGAVDFANNVLAQVQDRGRDVLLVNDFNGRDTNHPLVQRYVVAENISVVSVEDTIN